MSGHNFERLGAEIGRLVEAKNAAYGDSFGRAGDVMRILYPEGIAPEQFDDALAVIRVIDKLFRVATNRDAFGESPWADVAGYAIRAAARIEGPAARGTPIDIPASVPADARAAAREAEKLRQLRGVGTISVIVGERVAVNESRGDHSPPRDFDSASSLVALSEVP